MNYATGSAQKGWRPCPVCALEGGNLHWVKGTLQVVRCSHCGMLFANPVEAQFTQGTFYDQLAEPYYLSADKLASDYAPARFRREFRLFRRYCPKGSVLDVGCSTGAFLHQLVTQHPQDYTALGADVARPALAYAESRGVTVLRAPFLEHDFREQRFDAITFWAVMEHLADPRQFLAKARTLLKPGGFCFVLVPNVQSLATRFLGTRYRYVMAEHLNYFAEDTLKRLVAQEHGWSVVTLSTTHFNPVVIWQDWRRARERVPDAERAGLLKKTTAWKENPLFAPARLFYGAAELCLNWMRLADNLVIVLRRR